jgi:chromate reductase
MLPTTMDFFNQPVVRDTTPNAPREMLARLVTVLLGAALFGSVGALLLWLGRGGMRNLVWALVLALTTAALAVARRRLGPAASARADTPSIPASPASPATAGGATRAPRVLLLDASLSGPGGNCSALLDLLAVHLGAGAELERAALGGPNGKDFASLGEALRRADGFVIATGTHWDSWSSPLQKFLEDATPAEASALWLGKPAAVLVTEHSTGGKALLSRLQGVLVTLGCALPPLSGLVISKAAQLARRHAPGAAATEDFWSTDDLEVVAHNLLAALRQGRATWRAWPVDRENFRDRWLV